MKKLNNVNMDNYNKTEKSKKVLYAVVAVLAIASIAYRLIVFVHLEQTTLLFVGLPALITVLVIKFTGTPKSAYGIAFKTITIFLLMSGILLGEGVICIIMAAPLFYGVAAVLVYISKNSGPKLQAIIIIPILILGIESFDSGREQKLSIVTVTRVVNTDVSLNSLNNNPEFIQDIPTFFELGFPVPISVQGAGTNVGNFRKIQFESSTKGIGTLHLVIMENSENKVRFKTVSDNTHISHWLLWDEVEISLSANSNGTTTVNWTTSYRCALSPSWYFEPLERFAVQTSTNHLIDSYFVKK
jgi:hypothetical protein